VYDFAAKFKLQVRVPRNSNTNLKALASASQSMTASTIVTDAELKTVFSRIKGTVRLAAYDRKEEPVAEMFDTIYKWVFSCSPKERDGKAMWSGFPVWLNDCSRHPY
jgi:hypothetical protein